MNGDEVVPTKTDQNDDLPRQKIERVFEQVEMMALQKGDSLNFNSLSDSQKDKVLTVMQQNEDHAFEYNIKKIDNEKEIKLARISAGIFNQKTNRYTALVILIVFLIITVIILIFKEAFFIPWLTFLTGLIGGSLGGYGLAKNSKNTES